jgi:hypothetical protein
MKDHKTKKFLPQSVFLFRLQHLNRSLKISWGAYFSFI